MSPLVPPSNNPDYPCTIRCAVMVTLLYTALMLLFTLPLMGLPILFFDDGETLYNVFALLQGDLPYRDFYTHHFIGYVIPLYLLAKVTGYFPDLIRYSFIVNQVLLGLGTYLCARMFFSTRISALSGALAITARMPYVVSFFPLYQVSTCFAFILYFALSFFVRGRYRALLLAFSLCGVAFCIDQRGLLLVVVPLLAIIGRRLSGRPLSWLRACLSLGAFLPAPLAATLTLYYVGLFPRFFELTFVFPSRYRVGSMSFGAQLLVAIQAHRHLILETPLLLVLGLLGFFALLRNKMGQGENTSMVVGIVVIGATLFLMTSLGGRDFAYYTIPWLPFLALLAPFSLNALQHLTLWKKWRYPLLFSPLAITALSMPVFLLMIPDLRKRNDGILIADFLRREMKETDSLFIFGYRPDIYAFIPKRSVFPFMNTIYIHPDSSITGREARLRHLDAAMQEEFFTKFRSSPPNYLVIFDLRSETEDWSPAADFIHEQIASRYDRLEEFIGPPVKGHPTNSIIYKLRQ